jgi:hypothetical protein
MDGYGRLAPVIALRSAAVSVRAVVVACPDSGGVFAVFALGLGRAWLSAPVRPCQRKN